MSWQAGRKRNICKRITFTPDEWNAAKELHKEADGIPKYAQYGDFARAMLTLGTVNVKVVRPLTDPEPIAAAIDRIGVNVNQIAHWANLNRAITPDQVAAVRRDYMQIRELLEELFADRERCS